MVCAIFSILCNFSRAHIQSLKFFDAKQNNYFERPNDFMIDRHKTMLRATLIGCGQWPINHSLITDMFKDPADTVKVVLHRSQGCFFGVKVENVKLIGGR